MSDATSGWKSVSITVATGGFLHKGQVNFEMSSWCLQIDQKNNEIFARISALASNEKSNQKKLRALYTTNWMILFWLS